MQGDAGVSDKRLMVFEPEFARVLQVAERDTNTLSAIIRQAWDTGNLRILTKKQAASATDAYISIIGHITKHELKRLLTETATANGFGNRILWACVHRSKVLPEGGDFQSVNLSPLLQRLRNAVDFARGVHQIRRDENARAIWAEVYKDLSEGKPGLFGAITGRAEAQTLRLPDTYALLDCSDVVRAEHLMAGLAVWKYCEASARFIFGDALGDKTADEILSLLRSHSEGVTRTEIRDFFGRNKLSEEVGRALDLLQEHGRARLVREQEGQDIRPTERWYAL